MRISDWSSDVCSADLTLRGGTGEARWHHRGVFAARGCRRALSRTPTARHRADPMRQPAANPGNDRGLKKAPHRGAFPVQAAVRIRRTDPAAPSCRSEEHTSEIQSLMRISYALFCLKKNT